MLLKADQAGWTDTHLSQALEVSQPTVERVRKAFVEQGLEGPLHRKKRSHPGNQTFDGRHEAHLSMLAGSKTPPGRERWTLQLLADEVVRLEQVEQMLACSVRWLVKKRT